MVEVSRWLAGDEGVLLAGIVLGQAQGLSYGMKLAMRRTGLTHVVAASGYNVSVVAAWLMAATVKIAGRRVGIVLAALGILLYMYLAGWSAAVVRAGIMAILGLIAVYLGRPTDKWWVLGAASLGMVVFHPAYLVDIGWQLSVAATIGVLGTSSTPPYPSPKLGEGTKGRSILNVIWDELKVTLAAQVMTLPLIWHYFGNVSLIAPLSNIIILWIVPVIMEVGLLALIAGWVVEPVGRLIALLAWPELKYMTAVVSWMSGWKWASIATVNLSWIGVAGYYLILIAIMKIRKIQMTNIK